jgi:asparagine synthase (glutamine-hydrolysing)
MARQQVTVALSADGGDETFAGYNRYFTILKRWQDLQKYKAVPAGIIRAAKGLGFDSNALNLMETVAVQRNIQAYSSNVQQGFNAKELKLLLNTEEDLSGTAFDSSTYLNSNDDLNKLMALEYKTYMVDNCLAKVDRASMHVSLEAREPLLDHRIVEFAAQLPSSLKAKNNVQKALLKNLTHKYLPEEMMNRPKMGFSIPVLPWLKNELKDLLDHYTDEGNIRREEILNPEMVSGIKTKFLQGNDNKVNKQIWHLLVFRMWTEKWIGR